MPYKEKAIEKKYYAIGEVADIFNVATSLIRFWESEFDIIKPKKNRKGNYIHFKIKGSGKIIDELEKNESLDKNLLRYMTVKVKKFNLEAKYFSKKDEYEKKEYKKEYNRD